MMSNQAYSILVFIIAALIVGFFIQGCTLSFSTTSNMTHDGQATDSATETQSPTNNPSLTVPVSFTHTPSAAATASTK